MLCSALEMDLIPSKLPPRRLLTSLEPDPPPVDCEADADSPFALKGANIFSGNGRAVFVGILAGAILICVVGFGYVRHEREKREAMTVPRLFTFAKHKSLTTPPGKSTPAPVVVKLNSDLIHVSAIALGHPRLAVINGRSVAEGDWITVHGPTRAVTMTLRVLKIADGRIELTDGTQIISVELEIAKPIRREQN
jgi:hypothetical protein